MAWTEPRSWFERRNQEQEERYPELKLATPDMVSRVDALRVERGELPSAMTRDTTALAAQIKRDQEAPAWDPSTPDAAPNAEPWTPNQTGLQQAGNIDLSNRPRVKNDDGSVSTVRSISIEEDGRTILIPTVIGNRVVSPLEAIQHYRDSGEHLGMFGDMESANDYARRLHDQQADTLGSDGGYASSTDEMRAGRADAAALRIGKRRLTPPELTDPLSKRQLDTGLGGSLSVLDVGSPTRGAVLSSLRGEKPWESSQTRDLTEYEGIDTPFVRDLPDSGPKIGPVHLTPKTIAGFALGQAADPTTYLGVPVVDDVLRGVGAVVKGAAKRLAGRGEQAVEQAVETGARRASGDVLSAQIVPKGVLPGPVMATQTAQEAGTRIGGLLSPRGADQLGADYTVKDALAVATDLRRQASSVAQNLHAQGSTAIRALGPTVEDAAGNLRLRNVIRADGVPALMQDVLENPSRYTLTPAQEKAVNDFADVFARIKAERQTFGVGPNEVGLEDGQNFISRLAKENTKGQELNKGRGTGSKLGVASEKSRQFADPEEASRNGVVYAHPLEALDRYAAQSLKRAGDEHVKNLLVPFSETSAARAPAPLRAAHDGLTQRLAGLKGTYGRLDERLTNTVDAYLNSADPNLDALYSDLDNIKVGKSAVGATGPNFGKTPKELRDAINQVQSDIRQMRPAWKDAVERSRAIPAGRQTVGIDVAPALSGRDFSNEAHGIAGRIVNNSDAGRIRRFYSKGVLPDNTVGDIARGAAAISKRIVPLRAVGDISATFNQLAQVAYSHPRTFARNFVKAAGDMVHPERYDEYLAQHADDGAAHGLAVLGKVGEPTELEFGSWMERAPVFKQLQQQFRSITTRNRVDLFNQFVDTANKTGKPLDDLGKEQLARALNRVSGISNSRASDIETLAQFAPNFFRAHLETLSKAATDGTIEGQLARQYLKNMVALGTTISVATAVAQGRDPREVLNPIEVTADGGIRMNPNFGTVRVGNHDVSLYGSYDSLARLGVVGVDAVYRSIRDRDAMQLGDAIGYAASTKGGPLTSFISNAIQGETFGGNSPTSLGGLAEQLTPFSVSQFIADKERGASTTDALLGVGLTSSGLKANPLSASERVERGEFNDLGPQQQLEGYRKQSWQDVVGGIGEEGTGGAKSFYDWRTRQVRQLEGEFKKAGLSDAMAVKLAEDTTDKLPVSQVYSEIKNAREDQWGLQHPKEAAALLDKESALPETERRFNPTKPVRAFIEASR